MTLIRIPRMLVLATVGVAACSGSGQAVRPGDMSAEAQRQAAARQVQEANAETNAAAAQPNLGQTPNGNPEGYYAPVNPAGPAEHNARAQQLDRHAQEHLAAAAGLEAFEEGECKNIFPATRAACPLLGPATAIDDMTGGVRVRFTEAADVASVVAQMRCHLAYARARGFDRVASCALYLRGVEIVPEGDGHTVDIVSREPKVAAEIQVRAREEAILTTGGER